MNTPHKIVVLALAAVSLTACTIYPANQKSEPIQVLGQSEATLKIAYGASEQIWHTVQKKGACKSGVDVIDRKVIEKSPDFAKNSQGQITAGYVDERWDATGCGRTFPFNVKFAADGKGGTDIYTSPITILGK